MARGGKGNKGSEGKGKMTVVMFQLEGSDETIQEGFRVFGQALDKIAPSLPLPPSPASLPLRALHASDIQENPNAEIIPQTKEASDPQELSQTQREKTSPRKIPTMSFVKDLDLRPEDGQSLRDFHSLKNPSGQKENIAVFVYYLTKTLEIEGITPHHVFTCFKDVRGRTPRDLPQAIRETASRNGWVDSSDGDDIKITNHGENFVEHDLPKKPSASEIDN